MTLSAENGTQDYKMTKRFLNIAKTLKPKLIHSNARKTFSNRVLKTSEPFVVDFYNHYTGYVSLDFDFVGSPVDAPILLKIKFCEHKDELKENSDDYHGWVSKSWIQEELIHIDNLPSALKLKRRYAFRYISVELIASSSRYDVLLNGIELDSVSSAGNFDEIVGDSELEKRIDVVALRTLHECMQYEFEDGPKRDRRLWLGDLRLQALTNYHTYKNYDLVKRCLYLFAGTTDKNGRIAPCVFTSPKVIADDSFILDYSLLFVSTLKDYYENTHDEKTLQDLLPVATKQIMNARGYFVNDVLADKNELGWCFLDWNLNLNRQCGEHAVYIYAEKDLISLYKEIGLSTDELEIDLKNKIKAGFEAFFDKKLGVFVSGETKQISFASNVWMILANDFSEEENRKIFENLDRLSPEPMVTPYMYHHYIEALIKSGLLDKARKKMNEYWGAMIDDEADTFYELFNPMNKEESPYGGKAVLSYCHAWSCTPSYLLRHYFLKK